MVSRKGQSSFVTSWIFCLVIGIPVVASNVLLTRSGTGPVCPGQTVVFTCTTIGSSRLLWTSNEYIGAGSQFEFRSIDPVGTIRDHAPDVVANLTAVDALTSTLSIVASQSSTITCISGGLATTNSSVVQLATVPRAPRNVMAVETETSRVMENVCELRVTWDPPDNSSYTYRVYVGSQNVLDSNESSTTYSFGVPECQDDTKIVVAAVSRFGCEGLNSTDALLSLRGGPTTNAPSQLGTSAIAGIAIVLGLCIIMLMCIFFWIAIYCCCRSPDRKKRLTTDPHDHEDEGNKTEMTDAASPEMDAQGYQTAEMQAKKDYQRQFKYDIQALGTKKRKRVPIWVDDSLDAGWKDSLREAVKAINEAAPGLLLSTTDNKKQAIIHVLAISEEKVYTEGNIRMRSDVGKSNFITEIRLGKWEDDAKEGTSTRELFHALFNRNNVTRFDPLSIKYYQNKEACDAARIQHQKDAVWEIIRELDPTQMNNELSELDKVALNMVYPPCIDERPDGARYRPKLGKSGMYYCGRKVMSGRIYRGEECTRSCGPKSGLNCPACRTIKCPKANAILNGGRWQGMTGRIYCGRPFTTPENRVDGKCGMDNGPACPDCDNLLNQES